MAWSVRRTTYIDESRPIKPSSNFAGAATRQLDVTVWLPTDVEARSARGGRPLILYSHGTWGHAEYASGIVTALAEAGFIVAAPNYPLTSCTACTRVARPDISDVAEQIKDLSFLIDALSADPSFGSAIDATKIGLMGHSLGAVTSYFATFGAQVREPRVVATALTGAGDPVRAAQNPHMDCKVTLDATISVPTLFLSAEHDLFARMTGDQYAAYARIGKPKYQVMIKGGVHSWFHDADEPPADGKNPDCLFFEAMQPGMKVPGCEERVALIGPARQQAITIAAVQSFFAAYLASDRAALERLRTFAQAFEQAVLTKDI